MYDFMCYGRVGYALYLAGLLVKIFNASNDERENYRAAEDWARSNPPDRERQHSLYEQVTA